MLWLWEEGTGEGGEAGWDGLVCTVSVGSGVGRLSAVVWYLVLGH